MSSKNWQRPASVPVGTIWARFSGKALPSGVVPKFKITDITEDMTEAILKNMRDNYLHDEPYSRSIGGHNDPQFVEALNKMWKWTLDYQIGIVCLVENSDEIPELPELAGCNLTYPAFPDSAPPMPLYPAAAHYVDYPIRVVKLIDCFKKYQVPMVLASFGLSVDRRWRGHGIGEQLLRVRFPLGRAMGFKVTNGVFSSPFSKAASRRAGLTCVGEIKAEEFLVEGKPFFVEGEDVTSMELHVAEIV